MKKGFYCLELTKEKSIKEIGDYSYFLFEEVLNSRKEQAIFRIMIKSSGDRNREADEVIYHEIRKIQRPAGRMKPVL